METTTPTRTIDVKGDFQRHSFTTAQDLRIDALSRFESLGLPTAKAEEYRFTPIAQKLNQKFSWNTQAVASSISDISSYLIPNVDASVVVINNGKYDATLSRLKPQQGVTISSLNQAFQTHTKEVETYFNKVQPHQHDAFASLNTALWSEGVFIHVAAGVEVIHPVLILHVFDAQQSAVICHTRALVVLEDKVKLSMCERFDVMGTNNVFHNLTEEFVVRQEADLEYCRIQNEEGQFYQVTNSTLHQSDSSKLNTFTLTLDGQLIRNNFNIIIDGEHCESHFYGLYLLRGQTLADNHTVVDHRKPNSFSNEMYKGVMDGNSKGVFNGKIFVRPHAQKTNAFQSNRNIILNESASVNTKPQLEIWADDVKCSHGCTTGQLDEEALFYLQSRGIAQSTAKAMLLYAFAHEVLEPVKHEGLRTYLDQLIADRLHKNF